MAGLQAYLDNAEKQTGITPRQFLALAEQQGLSDAKPGQVVAWLKTEYGLGHGHATGLARLITKGPAFVAEHHTDGTGVLHLDGLAAR